MRLFPALPLALLLASSVATGQPLTREQVAAERAALEQRFDQAQAECEQRFAVSPCLDDLRKRRQAALAPLVQREHALATEERRARAQAQAQRVRERELAAAQADGQRGERLVAAAPPIAVQQPASQPPRARAAAEVESVRRQARQQDQADAVRRVQAREAREAEQRKRQADHLARQQRAKPPAAALPLPAPLPPASAAR